MNYKLVGAAALALSLAACTGQQSSQTTTEATAAATATSGAMAMMPKMASHSVTVVMKAQNGSGESGTATLTAAGAKTNVSLSLKGEPAAGDQPAHIHVGPCTKLGAVKYPLKNVYSGKSVTVVPAKLSALTDGTLAINVHASETNIPKYVSCGDIPKAKAGGM